MRKAKAEAEAKAKAEAIAEAEENVVKMSQVTRLESRHSWLTIWGTGCVKFTPFFHATLHRRRHKVCNTK